MLLGDLFTYNIHENTGEVVKATIAINPNHIIFEGHFPGVPVLPGVCQVQAVKELLQLATESKYQYTNVRDIKFMSMVIPKQMGTLDCEITYKPDGDEYKVAATLVCGEQNILKLRANFIKVK